MEQLDWDAIMDEPYGGQPLDSPLEDSLQLPPVQPRYWWQTGYVSDQNVAIVSDTDGSFVGLGAGHKSRGKGRGASEASDDIFSSPPAKKDKKKRQPKKTVADYADMLSPSAKKPGRQKKTAGKGTLSTAGDADWEPELPPAAVAAAAAPPVAKPNRKAAQKVVDPVTGKRQTKPSHSGRGAASGPKAVGGRERPAAPGLLFSADGDSRAGRPSELFAVPLAPPAAGRLERPAAALRRLASPDRLSIGSLASETLVRPYMVPVASSQREPAARSAPAAAGAPATEVGYTDPLAGRDALKTTAAAKKARKAATKSVAPAVAASDPAQISAAPARGRKKAVEAAADSPEDWVPVGARRPTAAGGRRRRRRIAVVSDSESEGDVVSPSPPPPANGGRSRRAAAAAASRLYLADDPSLGLSTSQELDGDDTLSGADSEWGPTPAHRGHPAAHRHVLEEVPLPVDNTPAPQHLPPSPPPSDPSPQPSDLSPPPSEPSPPPREPSPPLRRKPVKQPRRKPPQLNRERSPLPQDSAQPLAEPPPAPSPPREPSPPLAQAAPPADEFVFLKPTAPAPSRRVRKPRAPRVKAAAAPETNQTAEPVRRRGRTTRAADVPPPVSSPLSSPASVQSDLNSGVATRGAQKRVGKPAVALDESVLRRSARNRAAVTATAHQKAAECAASSPVDLESSIVTRSARKPVGRAQRTPPDLETSSVTRSARKRGGRAVRTPPDLESSVVTRSARKPGGRAVRTPPDLESSIVTRSSCKLAALRRMPPLSLRGTSAGPSGPVFPPVAPSETEGQVAPPQKQGHVALPQTEGQVAPPQTGGPELELSEPPVDRRGGRRGRQPAAQSQTRQTGRRAKFPATASGTETDTGSTTTSAPTPAPASVPVPVPAPALTSAPVPVPGAAPAPVVVPMTAATVPPPPPSHQQAGTLALIHRANAGQAWLAEDVGSTAAASRRLFSSHQESVGLVRIPPGGMKADSLVHQQIVHGVVTVGEGDLVTNGTSQLLKQFDSFTIGPGTVYRVANTGEVEMMLWVVVRYLTPSDFCMPTAAPALVLSTPAGASAPAQ